jgi:hypothetical protein
VLADCEDLRPRPRNCHCSLAARPGSVTCKLQIGQRAGVEADVMEGVFGDFLGCRSGLGRIFPEYDDARVVILHRQAPVVFGLDDFFLRQMPCATDASGPELIGGSGGRLPLAACCHWGRAAASAPQCPPPRRCLRALT